MPFATIASGTRLYYERIGSGPPLLLVMGTGLDHSVWDAQVEAYRNEFECIVFDNAGTGKSGRPDERLTVRSMATDTASGCWKRSASSVLTSPACRLGRALPRN